MNTKWNLASLVDWICAHVSAVGIFALVLLLVLVVAFALLRSAARPTADGIHISGLTTSFFFWLGMTYTVLLLVIAVFYNIMWTGSAPLLLGGLLPVGVPWFGALGAVTISLAGVFAYGQKNWDAKFNYWHIGRPVVGAVLGIVAFFMFVLIASSAGTTPAPFLEDPEQAKARDFIIYYVVAFLVGYREETFRELIRRVTDMVLSSTTSAGAPEVSFKHAGAALPKHDFGQVQVAPAVNPPAKVTIQVANTGKAALVSPRVTVVDDTAGVFAIGRNEMTALGELKAGEVKEVDVTFIPKAAGAFTGRLSVSGNNLSHPATVQVSGTGV